MNMNSSCLDCPSLSYTFNHESRFHKRDLHALTQIHTNTDMQAGGQNKVLMPEEKIRMTKENGTESGELQGGGQQRWRC